MTARTGGAGDELEDTITLHSSGRAVRSATTPRSERPPRSFWFDPRFGIGVALVVASVVGVVALVGSTSSTAQVWATRAPLTAGEIVHADDLVLRDVRLGELDDLYLGRDSIPASGVVLTRTIAAGELVPSSAVGSQDGERLAAVVVRSSGQLPGSIGAGTVVDIWSAGEADDGLFGPPAILVPSATVVRVVESDGLIVNGATTGVEVLVPRAKVAQVLEAIANEDSMSLVPVGTEVDG